MPLTEMEDANAKVLEAEMRKVGLLKQSDLCQEVQTNG